jgi:hypothetical protein
MRASLSLKALVAVALALSVAVPCLGAAAKPAGKSASVAASGGHHLADAWTWLRSLWPSEGCGLDPNGGKCTPAAPAPPPVRLDGGCGIDPDGQCGAAAQAGH